MHKADVPPLEFEKRESGGMGDMTTFRPSGNPVNTPPDTATRERDSMITQKPLSLLIECTSDQWRTNDTVTHEVRGGTVKPGATNERKRRDATLLEGLDALLKSLRPDEGVRSLVSDRDTLQDEAKQIMLQRSVRPQFVVIL